MCFGSSMSKTTKDLTASTVGLANSMTRQAGKVFGAADKTFNTISNAMTSIVNRGESQFGFSNGEFTAKNAAAVNAGATEQRNRKAQAAVNGEPFNAAAIDRDVADKTATAQNQILQQGYERGNQNFFKASGELAQAPGVYKTADDFNQAAMGGLQIATKAQGNRDAASGGGWKGLVKTGLSIAGDIGGSFVGDPMLGNQVMGGLDAMSASGKTGEGDGSATSSLFGGITDMFGKDGSMWNKSVSGTDLGGSAG